MRKIMMFLLTGLCFSPGLAIAQGHIPATTVQEPVQVIPLPWLAYRADGSTCGVEEWPDLGWERKEACYTVPDANLGTLVWDLTRAIRDSGDYELQNEFSAEEDGQVQIFQFWWDNSGTSIEFAITYVLDSDNPRFHVRYELPRSASE